MKNTSISDCRIMHLPKVQNRAGNITAIENGLQLPFEIRRVFFIYDIPGGKDRGTHAHMVCHQLLVAASGSFDVEIDDGAAVMTFTLNQPYFGLYIPPGLWSAELHFSSGAICLALVSELYEEKDYIRDYNSFLNYKGIFR